ncbi:MAG: cache domain-containing protein, partial [Oscillospiraceae bacterium]|nr:cache domain-containing protein [Oscillospiraceae bacterium]
MPRSRRFTKSAIFYFIVVLLATMTVPFIFLLLTTSVETQKFERDRAAEVLSNNLSIISSTTNNRLRLIEAGMTELLLNNAFTAAAAGISPYKAPIEYPDFKAMQTIKDGIRNTAVRSNDIENVYLYCMDAERLFVSNINWDPTYHKISLQNTPWFQTYSQHAGKYSWHITAALESDHTILSCYRILGGYQHPPSGLLSVNVNPGMILNTVKEVEYGAGNTSVVIDARGRLLYDPSADADLVAAVVERLPEESRSGTFEVIYQGASVFTAYLYSEYSGF